MDLDDGTKMIMISSDGEQFELSTKAAMRSQLVKDSIDESKEDIIKFTANQVKGNILKKSSGIFRIL